LLREFGITAFGYVVELGGIRLAATETGDVQAQRAVRDASEIYSLDPKRDDEVKHLIDQCGKDGDTLGGVVEVRIDGLPFGLGTHTQSD
jgi:chorismate synthase